MSGKPFPNAPTGIEVDTVHPERSLEVDRLRSLARRVAEDENREIGYLSIVLADHETVTRLNREYLGHDYETDVLSFPLGPKEPGEFETSEGSSDSEEPAEPGAEDNFPGPEKTANEKVSGRPDETNRPHRGLDEEKPGRTSPVRGEIYVDLDTAAERAPEFETTFEEEAARYLVHGLLHLMGYDDQDEEGQRRMRELEDRYLDLQGS